MNKIETGFLEIVLGPMFSGKTSLLIKTYHELQSQNEKVLAINYIADQRYHDTLLSSHDKVMIPCIMIEDIYDSWYNNNNINYSILQNSEYILINEAQFFNKLYEVVINMLEQNKKVYLYGLDGDFNRNKFGQMLDLIPFCDNIQKLHAKCNSCNLDAIFSHRITSESSQVVIGSDNYIPLCRNCYEHKKNK
jgi:thymidine kinase